MPNHLLIAGTGRAGTSFLVKYLTELGLDTHLTRNGASSFWDPRAQAGLEDIPLVGDASKRPYVVKSPYAYEFIDKLLEQDDFKLDGVIIPVRDLIEASSSRILSEMQHLNEAVPWLAELDETWEQWALTPGGVVYSLNTLDQARLLAVGFYHLVERLIGANIPIAFVHFPEMAQDADYLFERLRPVLPDSVTIEQARLAHGRIARGEDVRVGNELRPHASDLHAAASNAARPPFLKYPDHSRHDAIAQRRTNGILRGQLDHLRETTAAEISRLTSELQHRTEQLHAVNTALIETRARFSAASSDREQKIVAAVRWALAPLRAIRRMLARVNPNRP